MDNYTSDLSDDFLPLLTSSVLMFQMDNCTSDLSDDFLPLLTSSVLMFQMGKCTSDLSEDFLPLLTSSVLMFQMDTCTSDRRDDFLHVTKDQVISLRVPLKRSISDVSSTTMKKGVTAKQQPMKTISQSVPQMKLCSLSDIHLASCLITQPVLQPVSRLTTQPITQLITQQSSRPATQPTAQPTTQPVSHLTAQPVSHLTAQPVSQPAAQPVPQLITQQSSQRTTQPNSQLCLETPMDHTKPTPDSSLLMRCSENRGGHWSWGSLRTSVRKFKYSKRTVDRKTADNGQEIRNTEEEAKQELDMHMKLTDKGGRFLSFGSIRASMRKSKYRKRVMDQNTHSAEKKKAEKVAELTSECPGRQGGFLSFRNIRASLRKSKHRKSIRSKVTVDALRENTREEVTKVEIESDTTMKYEEKQGGFLSFGSLRASVRRSKRRKRMMDKNELDDGEEKTREEVPRRKVNSASPMDDWLAAMNTQHRKSLGKQVSHSSHS